MPVPVPDFENGFVHHQHTVSCDAGVPVTDATLNLWRGFVSLILTAYFERRMAWYPVDRLQTEVSATTGGLLYLQL